MGSNSDDFIEFSPNNSNISFFDYDSLNLTKEVIIKGNFNVKESLEIKKF